MKPISMLVAGIAAAVIGIPGAALAEDQTPMYLSVDCMKSTTTDYADIETDIWLPMQQQLVNEGKITSWALYWVQYGDRSKCDYYTVTAFSGPEQLNANPAIDEVFAAVHPDGSLKNAMARTWKSRQHVATELWLAVDGIEVTEHRYAVVNMMNARDPDMYERMESNVFKPGHQALVDGGHRSGWAMYELISPLGSSIPYNYSTVDFMNHLNPVPLADALMSAHPDRDLDALQDLLQLRDQVSSETWMLVATTQRIPAGE